VAGDYLLTLSLREAAQSWEKCAEYTLKVQHVAAETPPNTTVPTTRHRKKKKK
jgi:hypothetical protein